jgi:hypothetical protein
MYTAHKSGIPKTIYRIYFRIFILTKSKDLYSKGFQFVWSKIHPMRL